MTKVAMKPVGILMDARYNYGIYWYGPDIPVENTELYVVSPTKRRSSPRTKKEWVDLTDQEIIKVVSPLAWESTNDYLTTCYEIALDIQAKLKEKNT